jgi:uncharacterized membrane protein
MTKIVFLAFLTVTLAFLLHIVIVYYLPHLAMLVAFHQMKHTYGADKNMFIHTGTPSPEFRNVPKPDPNLLYSLCVYDISKHPVRITAPIPDCSSWSVACYAANSTNFYATNDLKEKDRDFSLTIAGKKHRDRINGRPGVVLAPSDTGMVIIRISIMGHKHPDDLVGIQKQAACAPVAAL